MIIEFASSTDPKIQELKDRFGQQTDVFIHGERIAITGITEADLDEADLAVAKKIEQNHPKAIQSSRVFHPEDIVVKAPIAKLTTKA